MMDMFKMMGRLKEVQAKMKEAQESLADIKVEGEAGAGMVKATMNAKKELLALEIDPSLINPEDEQMMKDLVVAAVNKASQEADEAARKAMKEKTEGLIPDIPGLDLGNMMG